MRYVKIRTVRVTLEQLDKALTQLGYVRSDTSEAVVFRHLPQDALIVLPTMAGEDVVSQAHLIAVRNNVVGKGIASQSQFQALLTQINREGRRRTTAARSLTRQLLRTGDKSTTSEIGE